MRPQGKGSQAAQRDFLYIGLFSRHGRTLSFREGIRICPDDVWYLSTFTLKTSSKVSRYKFRFISPINPKPRVLEKIQ